MNKLLCKLTGGHKYNEESVEVFQNILTGVIEIGVKCTKCGFLKPVIIARDDKKLSQYILSMTKDMNT